MTTMDQCPSTRGTEIVPEHAPELGRVNGRAYWRSLDEFAGTAEFKDFVEREFPAGASELLENSRRDFLKVMGAGLALAGAATIPGCRRPERKIYPYASEVPEEIIPGKALYYATAMALPGGGAEGLLVETHTGRPTKVEGNPLHPNNQGRSSVWAQASVLGMYDPDRLKYPVFLNAAKGRLTATWDDFKAWQIEHFAAYDRTGGSGLAFVVDKKTSPSRDAARESVLTRWPKATWIAWSPAETRGQIEGTKIAFGSPMRVRHSFSGAKVVVSLDSDFTCDGPEAVKNAREFASTRRVSRAGDSMSRLYVAESTPTGTGSIADHRIRLAPSRIAALAVALAGALSSRLSGGGALSALAAAAIPAGEDFDSTLAGAIADDLAAHADSSVLIAGPSQPAAVHALVAAINSLLGSKHVSYTTMSEEEASDSGAALSTLAAAMNAGKVSTLVCIETNPVYDAPAGSGFADAFGKVASTITLGVGQSETAAASLWLLNGAHNLEAWGDVEATDGTASVIQPMIAPLYEPALSDIELLSLLAGDGDDGHTIVTRTWAQLWATTPDDKAFTRRWRRALHDGVIADSASAASNRRANVAAAISAAAAMTLAAAPAASDLEVVFTTGRMGDGRWANNGWLQELPEIATTVVWDNPVCMSPSTAKGLGLLPKHSRLDEFNPYTKDQMPQARLATVSLGGRSLDMAVWIMPGMPDNTLAIKLGYGRTTAGLVGDEVGHNTYLLREAGATLTRGATLVDTGRTQTIASTQNHWSLEGRTSIVRAVDKKWWDKYGDEPIKSKPDEIYGNETSVLNFAEQLGELSHTPPNVSLTKNPYNDSPADAADGSDYLKNPQWGMSIDLNTCTGCGTCTIACQSENNIPIVGKSEVAKGREMSWIRVDRYFVGDDLNNPDEMIAQPVACVHCENAPCETVCPVNATVHGPEGTNNMAYNRCIGTRYCANNCPYKVRRFNFFDWAQSKFRGGLDTNYVPSGIAAKLSDKMEADRTFNENFIPPRLRTKLDEISKMQQNPDVTVRGRGVMEKCTYCIQRINEARQEVKIRGIWTEKDQIGPIPDGFFQTACQQACPSESIVFGDILDPASKVAELRENQRTYLLLGFLNTRPRTTYLARVRNPNPVLLEHEWQSRLAAGLITEKQYHDRMADPLNHGTPAEDSNGEPGGDSRGEGGGENTFIDRTKRFLDDGYSLSLRVLDATT